MSDSRKYCTPEFVFDQVFTQPYTMIYLVVIIGVVPTVSLYLFFISRFFSHGELALAFGMLILTASLIMKAGSKTVRIYSDDKSIFIVDVKGDFKRFLKKHIAGIYCYAAAHNTRYNIGIIGLYSQVKVFFIISNSIKNLCSVIICPEQGAPLIGFTINLNLGRGT